jgi:hypothetical protein
VSTVAWAIWRCVDVAEVDKQYAAKVQQVDALLTAGKERAA